MIRHRYLFLTRHFYNILSLLILLRNSSFVTLSLHEIICDILQHRVLKPLIVSSLKSCGWPRVTKFYPRGWETLCFRNLFVSHKIKCKTDNVIRKYGTAAANTNDYNSLTYISVGLNEGHVKVVVAFIIPNLNIWYMCTETERVQHNGRLSFR